MINESISDHKMKKNVMRTQCSEMWIDDDGILHIIYTKTTDVTIEVSKSEIRMINHMIKDRKIPTMVNLHNTRSITKEAREYLTGKDSSKVFSAVALIVNSPIHKIMGNFFSGINKPPFPVKLFSSEERANDWLRQYVGDKPGK